MDARGAIEKQSENRVLFRGILGPANLIADLRNLSEHEVARHMGLSIHSFEEFPAAVL